MATAVESPTTATAVQELSAAVSSPPEKYLLKDGIGTDFPVLVVPAIDLTLLTASSPHAEKELQKLKLAFSSCGYIQVYSIIISIPFHKFMQKSWSLIGHLNIVDGEKVVVYV